MAQWGCRSDAHPAVECRYHCGTASAVGSNQLGHHVAFKHTHAGATFPLRPDPDDSLERFLDAEQTNTTRSTLQAEMWTGLT